MCVGGPSEGTEPMAGSPLELLTVPCTGEGRTELGEGLGPSGGLRDSFRDSGIRVETGADSGPDGTWGVGVARGTRATSHPEGSETFTSGSSCPRTQRLSVTPPVTRFGSAESRP